MKVKDTWVINESECDFSLVLTQQGNLPNPVAKLGRQAKVAKLSPIHKKGEVLNPGNYRMIAVSGVMYRIFANVLKDLVADWCVKKGKIPDTQFGFFPSRITLHPLFILRHLRHAAKKLKPRNSPRLHVAFIDFSQAYDT